MNQLLILGSSHRLASFAGRDDRTRFEDLLYRITVSGTHGQAFCGYVLQNSTAEPTKNNRLIAGQQVSDGVKFIQDKTQYFVTVFLA